MSIGTYAIKVSVNDTSGNVLTESFTVTVEDTTAPAWDSEPTNQEVECGSPFRYDLNATDLSTIDYWAVNDTRFTIDGYGVLTNATFLSFGDYWLKVEVQDQYDNIEDATFKVSVVDTTPPVFIATPEDIEVDEVGGIYVNGEFMHKALIPSLNMNTNDQDLAIGGYADGTEIITAAIDDVRIYSKELTAEEIAMMAPCYKGAGCVNLDGKDGVNWVDYAEFMKGWNP